MHSHKHTHLLWPVLICLCAHTHTLLQVKCNLFSQCTQHGLNHIYAVNPWHVGEMCLSFSRQGDVDTSFSCSEFTCGFFPQRVKPTKAWSNIIFMLKSTLQYVQFILCTGSNRTLDKEKKSNGFLLHDFPYSPNGSPWHLQSSSRCLFYLTPHWKGPQHKLSKVCCCSTKGLLHVYVCMTLEETATAC